MAPPDRQCLKAHYLYKRDRDYVELNGEIVIVDEFTGRLMTGRQWSDGLHQAVEAKERVKIKEENQTLATITLQNFFMLYKKLAGMTGTAMTEANEFSKVYKLDVVAIPTNRPLVPAELLRRDLPDRAREVQRDPRTRSARSTTTGRPILVGTTSIEKSEQLSEMLQRHGIPHQVLNAKYHEREAEIVAQAGRKGAVTIATNMAGRGTDIILGGNPEFMAWADLKRLTDEDGRPLYPTRLEVPKDVWEAAVAQYEPEMKAEGREVAGLGGLHIIGTERHESRRIDNQLRGRSGPPGGPGLVAVLPLARRRPDAQVRRRVGLGRPDPLGMEEGEAIESKIVSRRIEGAQKKVEERNFDVPEEPARIRRGHGRAAEADLLVPPAAARRLPDQGRDPGDDRRPGARCRRPVPGRRLRRRQALPTGPASGSASSSMRATSRASTFEDASRGQAPGRGSDRRCRPGGVEENLPADGDPLTGPGNRWSSGPTTRYGLDLKDRDLRKLARETAPNSSSTARTWSHS